MSAVARAFLPVFLLFGAVGDGGGGSLKIGLVMAFAGTVAKELPQDEQNTESAGMSRPQ